MAFNFLDGLCDMDGELEALKITFSSGSLSDVCNVFWKKKIFSWWKLDVEMRVCWKGIVFSFLLGRLNW